MIVWSSHTSYLMNSSTQILADRYMYKLLMNMPMVDPNDLPHKESIPCD